MTVLAAIWLMVIGYGLLYVGYSNQSGRPISFKDAFLGSIKAQADPSQNPIQATGSTVSQSA